MLNQIYTLLSAGLVSLPVTAAIVEAGVRLCSDLKSLVGGVRGRSRLIKITAHYELYCLKGFSLHLMYNLNLLLGLI